MAVTELLSPSALTRLVAIRHDLHRHPELGYTERRTSEVVQRELTALGIEFKAGLAGGTGVLGYLPATEPGAATIALRADMDALPILEKTGKDYASETPGIMHACGHDGHTTILLGIAEALKATPHRRNNILFLFQPAEEGGAGGQKMCQDGVLQGRVLGPKADVIYGLHGSPMAEVGVLQWKVGAMMASASQFRMTIHGKGAHAAMPHSGIDPIVVASHIVVAWQSIVSRNMNPIEPVVVTVGVVHAGVAHNVIPDTAIVEGTHRTIRNEMADLIAERIESIAHNVAAAFGATVEFEWAVRYPVTVNDAWATERFVAIAGKALGEDRVVEMANPLMGGEDFSFYGAEIPASFYFLGLRPKEQTTYPNLHAPDFDFNDAAIPYGVRTMCELALAPL